MESTKDADSKAPRVLYNLDVYNPAPSSSDGGVGSQRAPTTDSSVLASVLSPRAGAPQSGGTQAVGSPKPASGSPRTPPPKFEDPMLTWKSRAPSLPIAVDMHTPATTQGMSPSSPALRFSPISVSGSLPKMRSGLSIGIGMERPLGRVSLGGPSMGGWSPGVGSPTGGSVGSSRLPSQSGAAPAGAAGSSSVVDGAPPWAAGSDDEGDEGDSSMYGGSSDRPSPAHRSSAAGTAAAESGPERSSPSMPQHLMAPHVAAITSGNRPQSLGASSSASISELFGGDMVSRRHSYAPGYSMSGGSLGAFSAASHPSIVALGHHHARHASNSMRSLDDDDFMKRLAAHRNSWRASRASGEGPSLSAAPAAGSGLQNKTHAALQQLLGEMRSASIQDGCASSNGAVGGGEASVVTARGRAASSTGASPRKSMLHMSSAVVDVPGVSYSGDGDGDGTSQAFCQTAAPQSRLISRSLGGNHDPGSGADGSEGGASQSVQPVQHAPTSRPNTLHSSYEL